MQVNKSLISFGQDVIAARHSVRQFTEQPIEAETKAVMEAFIGECCACSGLQMTLVTDEPNAYGRSFMAHYGKFKNVRNYICIVGGKDDDEVVGYWGEAVVLKAQELGLNTCWCGLTFSKRNLVCDIPAGKKLHVVIALGYGQTQGIKHKNRSLTQIAPAYSIAPEWFRRGVDCAMLAPTAINQQKFHFEYKLGNKVRAWTYHGPFSTVDLGIVKLHFEIGAGKEVEWV